MSGFVERDPGDMTTDELYGRLHALRHVERADCRECKGDGCTYCAQTGKELTRDDYLRLHIEDADDSMPDATGGSF